MKRLLSFLLLLSWAACLQAQTITAAEYYLGNTDPGVGLATPITVSSPSGIVALSWSVPTTGLTPHTIYRINTRVRTDAGLWGRPNPCYLIVTANDGVARLVTSMDYSIDGGAFTPVDVPDGASVNFNQVVSTTGLSIGLHRLRIRSTDNTGRTGVVHDGFFVVINTAGFAPRAVTQMEYAVDGGAFTLLDVADAPTVNFNQVISTTGLFNGLHRLRIRSVDDLGRTGQVHDGFFVVNNTAGFSARTVTSLEYWFDSAPPTLVDVTDGGIVPWSQILSTTSLSIGLHSFNVRAIDDIGRVGKDHRSFLIVSSPFGGGETRSLTAAEYYVNVDPGKGNGVPIPLPVDGVFDEGQEEITTVLNLPIGLHQVGIRFRDNNSRWSEAITDSIIIGPVLTIRAVPGTDNVILDWQSGSGADQFLIYRAANSNGPFTLIDSTAGVNSSYTDVGIVAAQTLRFYNVAFQTSGFSAFRRPELVTPVEK